MLQDYLLDWEQKFLDACAEGLDGVSVYYFAFRSYGDIGGGAIDDDLQFLAGGYILVIIYLMVALGKFNCRDQKVSQTNTFQSRYAIRNLKLKFFATFELLAETKMLHSFTKEGVWY